MSTDSMCTAGVSMTYVVSPIPARVRVDLSGHTTKRTTGATRAPSSTVPGIVWSDARIARLKQLWTEGYSAGRIAVLLGGISRSAVIGKVHRLGLSERKGSANSRRTAHLRPARKRVLRPRMALIKRRSPFAEHLAAVQASRVEAPIVSANDIARVTLAQLDADRPHQHCRWPVGDPEQPGFGYCGCEPVAGLAYCEAHARRAYTAPAPLQKTSIGYTYKTRVNSVRRDLVRA